MSDKEEPIAVDIYERNEMDANGEGGSVWNDLFGDGNIPSLSEFEDYFGDDDPFKYL